MEEARTRREGEVWQACDDLWARHGVFSQITGDAIRDQLVELGFKKGSPNEVYKYRKTWKLSRGVSNPDPKDSEQAKSDPISRVVNLVYEQIQGESEEEKRQLEEAYKSRLKKALENVGELQEQNQALKEVLKENESRTSTLAEEHVVLTKQHQQLERNYDLLREKNQVSENLFVQYQKDVARLQQEIENAHKRTVASYESRLVASEKKNREILLELEKTHKDQWHQFSEQTTQFQLTLRQSQETIQNLIKAEASQKEKNKQMRETLLITNRELARHKKAAYLATKNNASLEVKYAKATTELSMAIKRGDEHRNLLKNLKKERNGNRKPKQKSVSA